MKWLVDGAEMGSDLPYWEVAEDFGKEPPHTEEDLAMILQQKMNGHKKEDGPNALEA